MTLRTAFVSSLLLASSGCSCSHTVFVHVGSDGGARDASRPADARAIDSSAPAQFCPDDIVQYQIDVGLLDGPTALSARVVSLPNHEVVAIQSFGTTRETALWAIDRATHVPRELGRFPDHLVAAFESSDRGVTLLLEPMPGASLLRARWDETGDAVVSEVPLDDHYERPLLERRDDRDILLLFARGTAALEVTRWEWPAGEAPRMEPVDVSALDGFALSSLSRVSRLARVAALEPAFTFFEGDRGQVVWLGRDLRAIVRADSFSAASIPPSGALLPLGDDALALVVETATGTEVLRATPGSLTPWVTMGDGFITGAGTGDRSGAYLALANYSPGGVGRDSTRVFDGPLYLARILADAAEVEGGFRPLFTAPCWTTDIVSAREGGVVLASMCHATLYLTYLCVPGVAESP